MKQMRSILTLFNFYRSLNGNDPDIQFVNEFEDKLIVWNKVNNEWDLWKLNLDLNVWVLTDSLN